MKAEFINPFLESMINVLSTMAQIQAKPGKPNLKGDNVAKGDVTGIIGMAGEQAKGSLAITFTDKAIMHIASQMLGETIDTFDESLGDVAGEITNMVTGGAKRILSERGYKFEMAVPSTIIGKNHTITHNTKGPTVLIPFETDAGAFYIEVCFE